MGALQRDACVFVLQDAHLDLSGITQGLSRNPALPGNPSSQCSNAQQSQNLNLSHPTLFLISKKDVKLRLKPSGFH